MAATTAAARYPSHGETGPALRALIGALVSRPSIDASESSASWLSRV